MKSILVSSSSKHSLDLSSLAVLSVIHSKYPMLNLPLAPKAPVDPPFVFAICDGNSILFSVTHSERILNIPLLLCHQHKFTPFLETLWSISSFSYYISLPLAKFHHGLKGPTQTGLSLIPSLISCQSSPFAKL